MSWVAWSKAIGPVDYAGIGIGSLVDANIAMLTKWLWRFKSEQDALWRRLSNHGQWKQITGIEHDLTNRNVSLTKAIKGSLGDGASIIFWHHVWVGSDSHSCTFPNLYAIEQCRRCLVADRLVMESKVNGQQAPLLRRANRSQLEMQELNDICALLSSVSLQPGNDCWIWELNTRSSFSVKKHQIKVRMAVNNSNGSRSTFFWNN